jgi:hypothetical protein
MGLSNIGKDVTVIVQKAAEWIITIFWYTGSTLKSIHRKSNNGYILS